MRWKCHCAYDGSRYSGWQSQEGRATVQSTLNEALSEILKQSIAVAGSGRTDAGVHALGQVFHFDFEWRHGGLRLMRAIGAKLPPDIQVYSVEEADDRFHARYSAVSKRYHYRLKVGEADPFEWNYCWTALARLDLNRIRAGMRHLVGEHDFAAFGANRGKEYESTVRRMFRCDLRLADGMVYLTFEANGFMYKMARSLVGALVNVGMGRLRPEDIGQFVGEAKRSPLIYAAPSRGLYLEKVFY